MAGVIRDPAVEFDSRPGDFRAVLFDSGDTLLRFSGGRSGRTVLLEHYPDLTKEEMALGAAAINARLTAAPGPTPHVNDEEQLWTEAFREALSVIRPNTEQSLAGEIIEQLVEVTVFDPPVEPFPEVADVLETLKRKGIRMGVVSNAWPSLELVHSKFGLRQYFSVFLISRVLGLEKPDPGIFRLAIEGLGLEPAQVIFVDDHPPNVKGAAAAGLSALLLDRRGKGKTSRSRETGLTTIADLRGLLPLVERLTTESGERDL